MQTFTDEKTSAEGQVTALNQKLTQLQASVSDKDAKIVELEDQLTQMRSQLTSARAEIAQLKETPVVNPMDFSKGVVFKVQIGAFKNKDLAKYFENNPNFGGEVKENDPFELLALRVVQRPHEDVVGEHGAEVAGHGALREARGLVLDVPPDVERGDASDGHRHDPQDHGERQRETSHGAQPPQAPTHTAAHYVQQYGGVHRSDAFCHVFET